MQNILGLRPSTQTQVWMEYTVTKLPSLRNSSSSPAGRNSPDFLRAAPI